MGRFALHNRKNSSYIPQNELSPASNRKKSAYFTFANDAIKPTKVKKLTRFIKNSFKPWLLLNDKPPLKEGSKNN
jgi:hypothetical protein